MQRKLTSNEIGCLNLIRNVLLDLYQKGVSTQQPLLFIDNFIKWGTSDGDPLPVTNNDVGAYVMTANDGDSWQGPRILARAMTDCFLVVSTDNSCHWTAKYCRFATDEEISVMEANNVAEAA
jgi:hypothetical protein